MKKRTVRMSELTPEKLQKKMVEDIQPRVLNGGSVNNKDLAIMVHVQGNDLTWVKCELGEIRCMVQGELNDMKTCIKKIDDRQWWFIAVFLGGIILSTSVMVGWDVLKWKLALVP